MSYESKIQANAVTYSKAAHTSSKRSGEVEQFIEDPQVEDSFYSWVVAAGAALQFILVGGIHKSFGLLLAALVQEYGFTSAQVAVIPALFYSGSFLIAPVCGALCRRFSERTVGIGGGILTMLGLAFSGLTSNIYALYVTNGVIFGIGQGFANLPGTLMVTKYFVKRRGLANSITAASAAIGGVFFPLMVQGMLEEYGIPGTYLMMGGFQLHTIISAMLYRPMDKQREIMRLEQMRNRRRQRQPSLPVVKLQQADPVAEKPSLPDEAPSSARLLPQGYGMEKRPSLAVSESAVRNRRPSATLVSSTIMLSQLSLAVEPPEAPRSAGCWQQVLRSLDLHLLTDPLYVACVTSVFLFTAGLPHVCLLVPRFGLEIDVSRGQTASMIATIAPIDIVSRLSLGFLLDRNLFHKRYGLFITCLVGGTGVLALVFVRSYAELFAACAVVYAAVGFYFVVTPVMYAEYYGVERLSSTLTMSNLFAGVANLTAQPLGGLLRDAAGTFRTVFAVLSGCMLAGGALVLLHPCIARRSAGRRNKQAETDAA
ncbi:Monocarboxylate transporter 7 [Amphibalanus amphitrite]|uniref:Monocarboxylate transporter 7 n=2 Tax=Amphibalanus amphitrite TaxID=1232801 RepID=A0A6A4WRN2_AMPAM|nr:Monocarboxylate transporter 7 [Amphibalanus amphitrite]